MSTDDKNKQITGIYGYEKSPEYGMQSNRPSLKFWLFICLGLTVIAGAVVLDAVGLWPSVI